MKAHIPPKYRCTKKQKIAAQEYADNAQKDNIRRVFKLIAIALNETYGFGKLRTGKVLAEIDNMAKEKEHDPVFWAHVDRRVKQIGFNFPEEDWTKGFE